MLKRFVAPTVVLAGLLLAPLASSLAARPQEQRRPDESRPALENRLANRRDGWGQPVKPPVKGQKSDPAPKRDLSGIWDPGDGGIQALGPAAMPDDGKPEHRPPFSAAGLKALDERTWMDHVGRPHSDALRVEERFHRVDRDHLELSVTIDDPKMYTKPWVALDKLVFNLEPQTFDVREMFWSPTEFQGYNKLLGNEAAGTDK